MPDGDGRWKDGHDWQETNSANICQELQYVRIISKIDSSEFQLWSWTLLHFSCIFPTPNLEWKYEKPLSSYLFEYIVPEMCI